MQSSMRVENSDKVVFTLSVTLPLEHWRRLREQLSPAEWPATEFSSAIYDMVQQAERQFRPKPEDHLKGLEEG